MPRWKLCVVLLAAALAACGDGDPGAPDASGLDAAAARDARTPDAVAPDAPAGDAAAPADAAAEDAAAEDAAAEDAAAEDAAAEDAAAEDATAEDAAAEDAGAAPVCGNGIVEGSEVCDSTCCNSTCDAPLSAGEACADCPRGSDCAGCYGGACLDTRFFCAEILARGQSVGDGVYDVLPSRTTSVAVGTSTQSAYCDMTTAGGGWTMIYKKSRTVAGDGAALWSGTATNTTNLSLLHRGLSPRDYNSAWQTLAWDAFAEARVEVVTGTVTEKFIEFDLTGTTMINWFSPTRHTASSWTDLPTAANFDNGGAQAFRIGSGRSFYINRLWGGCPSDRGWLMISTVNTCSWETSSGSPTDIIYSRLTTESHIPTAAQTGYADTLVVLVR